MTSEQWIKFTKSTKGQAIKSCMRDKGLNKQAVPVFLHSEA